MSLVLDGSTTLAFCFEDERDAAALAVLARVVDEGACVPPVWRYEVANALLQAERRRRIKADDRGRIIADLSGLNVVIDDGAEGDPFASASRLAAIHGLTVYDAAYLELAQRRRLPLATLDKALVRAARASGVDVLTNP